MSRNFGLAQRGADILPFPDVRQAQVRRRGAWWSAAALAGALLAGIALSAVLAGCAVPVSAVPNYEPGLPVWCYTHPHRGTCP